MNYNMLLMQEICSLLINRDDEAAFGLDILTTCKQHTTPAVPGKYILTTCSDYVNKYLQCCSQQITALQLDLKVGKCVLAF